MTENTPQNPYEPGAGGPTPPAGGPTPPPGDTTPPPSGSQPPAYGGASEPPAYGGAGQPPAYGGPGEQYGTQPSGSFQVGEALGFGWRRFTGNWLFWVLFSLLIAVVSGIFNGPSFGDIQELNEAAMRGDVSADAVAGVSAGSSTLQLVGSLVTSVLSALGINAALREVGGEKATWGALFKVNNFGMVVVAALLLLAASFVGLLACLVGVLVVAIFSVFTYHNVVDRNLNAWAALTTSFRQVGQNFGSVFLLELAVLGITILGTIACLVGLLVASPLCTIAVAYAYRRISGGPVAAV
ncbi:MAG TPA: hypothetical protein VKY86_18085 [Promicromonospora sp.]|nr:hypothetical protein [Promicromonospora sp.]